MYIARWNFQVRFGRTKDALDALRTWELGVGERIGWRTGSVRVLTGLVGASPSSIEYEARADSLSDIESAWARMKDVPRHESALAKLGEYIVAGSDHWTVHRVIELTPDD